MSDVRRSSTGPARGGERLQVTLSLGNRPTVNAATVIGCQPMDAITFRYESVYDGLEPVSDVTYQLRPRRGGVRVTQLVDLSRAILSPAWRVVIWIGSRFGRSTGNAKLEILRDLFESR
jgi:uncharacterized protein (DUF58 family)